MVWQKCSAPPSARSSRATAVMTTCLRRIRPRRLRHPLRLVRFQRQRPRRLHRAKAAGPRAMIARDHERRRPLAPAFPMVRALGAFANRMELQLIQQRTSVRKTVGGRQARAQPLGADADEASSKVQWCSSGGLELAPTKTAPVAPCQNPPAPSHRRRSRAPWSAGKVPHFLARRRFRRHVQ